MSHLDRFESTWVSTFALWRFYIRCRLAFWRTARLQHIYRITHWQRLADARSPYSCCRSLSNTSGIFQWSRRGSQVIPDAYLTRICGYETRYIEISKKIRFVTFTIYKKKWLDWGRCPARLLRNRRRYQHPLNLGLEEEPDQHVDLSDAVHVETQQKVVQDFSARHHQGAYQIDSQSRINVKETQLCTADVNAPSLERIWGTCQRWLPHKANPP